MTVSGSAYEKIRIYYYDSFHGRMRVHVRAVGVIIFGSFGIGQYFHLTKRIFYFNVSI